MEIGKHQLSLLHQRIFGLDGLFHLHNHVGCGVGLLDGGGDDGARCHIVLIRETATLAGRMLHDDAVSALYQFCHSRRGHAHPVLIVLDFFWHTYFHSSKYLVKHLIIYTLLYVLNYIC